jgi:hypothetical protein
MKARSMFRVMAGIVMALNGVEVLQAGNAPSFDYQNIMDTYFDDTAGLISFGDYTVAFAPEESFDGFVAVLDAAGQEKGRFAFFPDYQNREGVFARVRAQGPADVTLTEPGIYTIVFVVGGQPVSRFPVRLEQTSQGDDPFSPQKTYRFDGYWRTMAHFTTRTFKDEPVPELTLWVGGKDLPVDASKGRFRVSLLRDGERIGHSQHTQGFIPTGHFKRTQISIYHPHAEKESPNARLITWKDLGKDGAYEVVVTRLSDGQQIRSFDFDVVDGKIKPMARAVLGFQPPTDFVLPRVLRRGSTALDMGEAIWIEDHR